ncbi:MAG TPA: hypothetical protein VJ724_05995 [Tahibacter sp.]|nr:hypothetical protein [Tahibacter sp.]
MRPVNDVARTFDGHALAFKVTPPRNPFYDFTVWYLGAWLALALVVLALGGWINRADPMRVAGMFAIVGIAAALLVAGLARTIDWVLRGAEEWRIEGDDVVFVRRRGERVEQRRRIDLRRVRRFGVERVRVRQIWVWRFRVHFDADGSTPLTGTLLFTAEQARLTNAALRTHLAKLGAELPECVSGE